MNNEDEHITEELPHVASIQELARMDEARFKHNLESIIQESEDMRLRRMKQHRTRSFIAMNLGILSVLIGVSLFGWFFLINADVVTALVCFFASLIPPILLNIWAAGAVKGYLKEHKNVFMPKLANALNGLTFHPSRGVSSSFLGKVGVVPKHDRYEAEDCFMGTYKGVKVIFSEARLFVKSHKREPIFDGIFVLLEIPSDVIEGHTIITADKELVKQSQKQRWSKLQRVFVSVSNPAWDRFQIFSNKPDVAELMVGERLLKELSEASEIFNNSPLSAVLFGKKYVFMMIPHAEDMFEASNLFVPVATNQHALKCKKEIEQILEIIDVFDLYKPMGTA